MAKKRKIKRTSSAATDVDAALAALCGTSRAAGRKYKARVEKKARHDAETYARFLRELGLPESATHRQVGSFQRDLRRTLASIYHASIRQDADCSTELARLAYRFAMDPTRNIKGDTARFVPKRLDGAWVIHEYPSVKATLLPPAPKTPVRKYTVPFTVNLLDCILAPRRDLPRLHNLIVEFLGRIPDAKNCLRANNETLENNELAIEIDRSAESVRFCGAEEHLAYTPFRIFKCLCGGNGQVVTDAALIQAVSFGAAGSTLRTHIWEIRSALRRAAGRSKDKKMKTLASGVIDNLIRKKRGLGYWIDRPDLIRFI